MPLASLKGGTGTIGVCGAGRGRYRLLSPAISPSVSIIFFIIKFVSEAVSSPDLGGSFQSQ